MKKGILLSSVVILLFSVVALAAPKPDYSGKWKLDFSKCEGVPQGTDQVMTINQKGDELNIITKVYPAQDMIASVINDIYALNGQETKYVAQFRGEPGDGKRVAKWSNEGWGVEVTEEATIETKQGAVKLNAMRKWTLAPDGKTITIELTAKTPQGETKSKRVFVKV
jgi:hypothetical protein